MKELTTGEVLEKLENKETLHLIDVREDEEVAQGIIPTAEHIPLGQIPEKMQELDKDTTYIMVCRSGGRSGNATQFLEQNGYQAINMAGGMLDWNGPTE